MKKSHNIGGISSVISIWEAPACKESADANEHKTAPTSIIGIEALRIINRIVWTIRQRIEIREATTLATTSRGVPQEIRAAQKLLSLIAVRLSMARKKGDEARSINKPAPLN